MKKINIFIGSSIDESKGLTADRDKLASFVNGLNNRYIDRGYYINLYLCENTLSQMDAEGSQKKHDDYIENIADASFFLFFKDAGEFTMSELALAHKTLKSKGRPAIFVFFKTSDMKPERTDAIKNVVNVIANEYSHYYKVYNDIDTVKLEILQYFASILPAATVAAQDGKVYLNKEAVDELDLNNIFAYQNSMEYKELSADIDRLKIEIDEAVQNHDYKETERLCNLKKEKTESLHELEKNILEMLELLQKELSKQEIDKPRITMLRLLERGDYKGAINLCPLPDAEREAELFLKRKELSDEKFRQEALSKIETAKVCILALKMDNTNPARFEEIDSRYNIACNYAYVAQDGDIVYEYVKYLYDQKDYKLAIQMGERLESDFEHSKLPSNSNQKSMLYNLIAGLYNKTQRLQESEEYYEKLIKIIKRMVNEDSAEYESDLASIYNNIAQLYRDTQRLQESEEYHKRAIEIRERLSKNNPTINEPDLANSYNNIAILYRNIQRLQGAEEYHKKAIAIRERLIKENPAAYEPFLANSYNNIAVLYKDTQRLQESEEYYKKAIEIRERLVKENPAAYEPDLASSYNNIATLYRDTQRLQESEEYYKKAIEIRERLVKENPDVYEPDLTNSYNNIAILCINTKRLQEAEVYLKKEIEIEERLAKDNSSINEPDLANSYFNLIILYAQMQRDDEMSIYMPKVLGIAVKYPQNDICNQIIECLSDLIDSNFFSIK